MRRRDAFPFLVVFIVGLTFGLGACQADPQIMVETGNPESTPTLTPFPPIPSETPVALAARVNGEIIPLEAYLAEAERYELAVGTKLATDEDIVLNVLIDEMLLAQAAAPAFIVDEKVLEAHIEDLGLSDEALAAWMVEFGYSQEEFEQSLSNSIAAAWMRDEIAVNTPDTAEQVHARQILLYNLEDAEKVYAQLESGTSFEILAAQYAPKTLGDLGWFPRGYLTVAELDEIIFSLNPNEYSPILETRLGFHIVKVLAHDQFAKLSPAAKRLIEAQAVKQWLRDRRSESEIIIY